MNHVPKSVPEEQSTQITQHQSAAEPLPVVRAAELRIDHAEQQQWLICGLWAHGGVGLIGGAPKCCKSWLGLEMAVSLTSQTPCLGAFVPTRKGKVLLYMAEDAAAVVKSRLDSLARHHGTALGWLDIFVITQTTLRIDVPAEQSRLQQTVARIRPDMLLLDPLVRLHRIDENSAGEVSALLAFLRSLQREFQTAVVLVHHARKNGSAHHPGQALRGSSDLHAFGDSNLYLKRHQTQLLLTIEHRAAPSPVPIQLRLIGGETPHLELAESSDPVGGQLTDAVREILSLKGPMTRAKLRQQLRIRNERLGQVLTSLQEQGWIQRAAGTWMLSATTGKSTSTSATAPSPGQQAFPFPLPGATGNGTEKSPR